MPTIPRWCSSVCLSSWLYVVATEGIRIRHRPAQPDAGGLFWQPWSSTAGASNGGSSLCWEASAAGPLMIGGTILTAFNDNAAITYLASLVPGFTEELKYAVMAGAVTGGGLTVIANALNPAGQSILQQAFGENGIKSLKLFLAALIPTLVMGAAFMLLPLKRHSGAKSGSNAEESEAQSLESLADVP